MTFKRCSTCGGFMDRRYFHRDKTRRDGLACRCKKCESERQRLLYRKRRRGLVLCIKRPPGDARNFPSAGTIPLRGDDSLQSTDSD